ncbi:hypothetical protein [Pseudomonas fluorescens]|uniref:hypothetical protein n=1 Tax=Pseudomonas fluorescens TaxID=294 RepID=UPI000AA3FABA|nr:hypothetical protein [Pseudomonas fluorescens]
MTFSFFGTTRRPQARRDLLNTKLDMLQSYVSLHTHTGQMNRAVLEQVQSLF